MKDIIINNITEDQLCIQICEELLRILESIPVLSNIDVHNSNSRKYDIEACANISLNEKFVIICNVKKRSEPLYVRKAAEQLIMENKHLKINNRDDIYCMIAAPYISQESSKICEDIGVGYVDLSGNCLLKYRSLYVRVEGNLNKYSERRRSKSLFERSSVRSSIILRHILQNPVKKWKLQELADVSSSSIGQVSKVKNFLLEREFIISENNGFYVIKPKELIIEWAKVYNLKPNTVYECYSTNKIPYIEEKIIDMKYKKGIECVLTSFAGAVRYAPSVNYNKIHVYVPLQDFQEAITFLGCKKVTSGSNISIIVPYDQCVLLDARNIKGSLVASPVQVCLDLLGLKGRGEEAAEAILRKEL